MTEPEGEKLTAEEIVANAESGVDAVFDAYTVPGPGLKLHYRAKRKLWAEWPTLAIAIERLVDEKRQGM